MPLGLLIWWEFVIRGIEYALWMLADRFQLPVFAETLFWAAVPLLITGGFHVDGFMDVQDAFNSYKPKEEKLKILKDPHIGAFEVISLGILVLLYISFTYLLLETKNNKMIAISCIGFALMRDLDMNCSKKCWRIPRGILV